MVHTCPSPQTLSQRGHSEHFERFVCLFACCLFLKLEGGAEFLIWISAMEADASVSCCHSPGTCKNLWDEPEPLQNNCSWRRPKLTCSSRC